jgi:hypothetical protein
VKTTIRQILDKPPCRDGIKLINSLNLPDSTEVTPMQMLEFGGIENAVWGLRCFDYKDYCLFLADVAESVLYIFEEKYPDDKRPRLAIDAIRLYYKGEISISQLDAAYDAAADAAAAADAEAADTYYATDDAAAAAATAAYTAVAAAVADTTVVAAYYAAADDAATYTPYTAVAASAKKQQWAVIEGLYVKHFSFDRVDGVES